MNIIFNSYTTNSKTHTSHDYPELSGIFPIATIHPIWHEHSTTHRHEIKDSLTRNGIPPKILNYTFKHTVYVKCFAAGKPNEPNHYISNRLLQHSFAMLLKTLTEYFRH